MLVQSCYKAWWNSLYFIFLYKPKNRFVYFFFWVAGICAVRFRRLTYLLNDSIISLLARVSWYRAHLISSAIPLYRYLLVIPDKEIIYTLFSNSAISPLACVSWYILIAQNLGSAIPLYRFCSCLRFLIHSPAELGMWQFLSFTTTTTE